MWGDVLRGEGRWPQSPPPIWLRTIQGVSTNALYQPPIYIQCYQRHMVGGRAVHILFSLAPPHSALLSCAGADDEAHFEDALARIAAGDIRGKWKELGS